MVHAHIAFQVAAVTGNGLRRTENQDTVTVDDIVLTGEILTPLVCRLSADEPRLFMVADGMGGHVAGKTASRSASIFLQTRKRQLVEPYACERILASCNQSIYGMMEQDERHRGMGTTIIGMCAADDHMTLFNVGDSRCYQRKENHISLLSIDDVPNSPPKGPGGDARIPGMITQALGGYSRPMHIDPHVISRPLEISERYMLCSDGLTEEVGDDVIGQVLLSENDARRCVLHLFERAVSNGGRDNISILVVDVVDPGSAYSEE